MIAFVRGQFAVKTPARVVVDVNGVGYDLQISLNTYSAISNKDSGLLFTYLHITENAQTLFGFAELAEKEIFLQLISVSGVGAATARMMLSGMRPVALCCPAQWPGQFHPDAFPTTSSSPLLHPHQIR